MSDTQNTRTHESTGFSRRDVLKTAGAAGVIGAFGAETAAAKRPKRFYVGTKPGKAHVAKRRASEVSHVVEAGDIGPTVVGRWPEEALRGLRNNPHIRYVEEEQFDVPHYDLPDEILPWGVDRVDAEEAHSQGDTGSTVHVAISDTGIDADHPDLMGNLGDGFATGMADDDSQPSNECADGSHPDGDCDEVWDDTDGHGTHVAGTVAAIANTEGVVGVAPDVTLHAVKIFPNASHANIKEGLVWAADHPDISVVNMSHGGSDSQTKKDGIEYAANAGLLLVSSAGNDGNKSNCDDDDCIGYPAAYDEVIAVSNVTDDDTLSSSSSVGPEMDIAAPGDQIPSTWFDGEYNTISGTSMASPHVAGAGALLIGDGEDAAGARSILESTAVDIDLKSYEQGKGLLDVAAALGHNTANDLLEVETDAATGLDFTEATLNGDLTQLTGSASATLEFEWGESGSGLPNTVSAGSRSTPGSFDATLIGLEENTAYEFRAKATNAESSTEYGTTETFSTVDNLDPTANITHSPSEPNPDETVTFDGSGSTSGDGSDELGDAIVSYEWDLDNDGTFDDATGVTASRSYTIGGTKTVGLRVTDEFDQTDNAAHSFYVNKAPTASFTVLTDPVVRDEPATFDASGSFDPDGTVDLYEWDWDYDGTFAVDESTTSATTAHTFTTGGEHTVALRVTDNDGATSEVVTTTLMVYIRVGIDIAPNANGTNPINPSRSGNVPVAVLHTSAFDPPTELDPATVHFGDPDDVGFDPSHTPQGGATPVHPGGHVEDVNEDGDMDSVFHFPNSDTGFDPADTEGELVGLTHGGVPVFGTDSVKIVGGGGP